MGRLWQTIILKEWKSIFAWLPVETLIKENQAEYYKTIEKSTENSDSGIFVEFMLGLILDSLKLHIADTVNDTVNSILNLIKENPFISYDEIAKSLKKSRATVSRSIAELKKQGLLERIGADKNGRWQVKAEV